MIRMRYDTQTCRAACVGAYQSSASKKRPSVLFCFIYQSKTKRKFSSCPLSKASEGMEVNQ